MKEEEPQDVQTEQPQSEKWYAPLTRVTPLAKYLAMVLFVVLPFVGFWLGVEYGIAQQEVEVLTQPVEQMMASDQNSETMSPVHEDWIVYRNSQHGFSFKYPPELELREVTDYEFTILLQPTERSDVATEVPQISMTIDAYDAESPKDAVVAQPWGLLSFEKDCDTLFIAEQMAYKCAPMAIQGSTYVIPLSAKEALYVVNWALDAEVILETLQVTFRDIQ